MFKTESAFVWHTLRRLGVPSRDLEDITHDVFIAVFRRLPDYDATRALRPWLFDIAYRTMLRYKDLARHREVGGHAIEREDQQPRADEKIARAQAQQRLDAALVTLQLEQRAIFVMHDIEEYSMPEIAGGLRRDATAMFRWQRGQHFGPPGAVAIARARDNCLPRLFENKTEVTMRIIFLAALTLVACGQNQNAGSSNPRAATAKCEASFCNLHRIRRQSRRADRCR